MVSRMLVIAAAAVLTCTPAALAISGSSEAVSKSAAVEEYGGPVTPKPTAEVAPTTTTNADDREPEDDGVGPVPDGGGATPVAREQGAGTPSSPSSLPFTGGPVLPLVLGALALLTVGGILRRASTRPAE